MLFMAREVDFLGIILCAEGLRVNPEKVEIMQDWPRPESVSDIRSFLGLATFFRRFIHRFSVIARPLPELTKKGRNITDWSAACDKSFTELKQKLVSAPILVHPQFGRPFKGHTRASHLLLSTYLLITLSGTRTYKLYGVLNTRKPRTAITLDTDVPDCSLALIGTDLTCAFV